MQDEWTQISDSDLDIGHYVNRENVHVETIFYSDGKVAQNAKVNLRISIFKVNESMNEASVKDKVAELTKLHLSNDKEN